MTWMRAAVEGACANRSGNPTIGSRISNQEARAATSRHWLTSETRTSKASGSSAGTSTSQRIIFFSASCSRVDSSTPKECAGVFPSTRCSNDKVASSRSITSPLSANTKGFPWMNPFGFRRGESSERISGSAFSAAARPCAVQRSKNVSRFAIPGSGANLIPAVPSIVPQPPGPNSLNVSFFAQMRCR